MSDMIQSPKVIDGINWAFRAFNNNDPPEIEMDNVVPFRTFKDELIDHHPVYPMEEAAVPKPKEPKKKPIIFEVMPGEPLPENCPDYRPLLQRDGLILWSWEIYGDWIRIAWLSANRGMFKYQAVTDDESELSTICPEKKYDWDRWGHNEKRDFIIYAAPSELTINTRSAFVAKLKASGVSVNFDYEFSLGRQKAKREAAVLDRIENRQNYRSTDEAEFSEEYRQLSPGGKEVLIPGVTLVAPDDDFQTQVDDFLCEMGYIK
jgi:hypothetical protein